MSHFLPGPGNQHHGVVVKRPHACVKVELVNKTTLRVLPGVALIKPGTYVQLVPEKINVIDGSSGEISASGRFYVTSETIDPYHLLIDVLDGNLPF